MGAKRQGTWLVAITLAMLAGCATDPRLGLDGKIGYIHSFYSADRLRGNPPGCLLALTPAQIAAGTYAEITVWHGRSIHYVSALVPPSITPALHDKVEIAPSSCKDGKIPEVRQVLSGKNPLTERS